MTALQLRKTGHGDTLHWSGITGFGADAVMVAGSDLITQPDDQVKALTGKERHIVGKRVLSSAGQQLGTVADVEFDATSGAVTALVLDDGEVPGSRLVDVGSYAVVVRAQ